MTSLRVAGMGGIPRHAGNQTLEDEVKRIVTFILLISLALSLVAFGCAKPAPSPTPSPAKPSASAPAPKPSVAPTAKPSAAPAPAGAGEKIKINVLGAKLGASDYVFGYAAADIINKNSSKLNATAVETSGLPENARTLAEELDKRKNTIIISGAAILWQATNGKPPFPKPYTSLKVIINMRNTATGLFTKDPTIKTAADLAGKRVAFGSPANLYYDYIVRVLQYGYGNLDKIKVQQLGFDPAKNAILDGLLDVAALGSTIIDSGDNPMKPKKVALNPATAELANQVKMYGVDIEQAMVDKARKATGFPLAWAEIPANSLGATQPNPFGATSLAMVLACDSSMDETVIYEVTRVLYENAAKFKEYDATGAGINQKSIPIAGGLSAADFHPGALKFFKERGIQAGG